MGNKGGRGRGDRERMSVGEGRGESVGERIQGW